MLWMILYNIRYLPTLKFYHFSDVGKRIFDTEYLCQIQKVYYNLNSGHLGISNDLVKRHDKDQIWSLVLKGILFWGKET